MADRSKTCFACPHCGELFSKLSGTFCSSCNTPKKREEMDEENRQIWKESKKEYHCEFCEKELIKKNGK